jgi:hypothetical protein
VLFTDTGIGNKVWTNEQRKQYEEEEEEVQRITPWSERCVNLTSREKRFSVYE